jgi:predicted Ser/Thr protein kinase
MNVDTKRELKWVSEIKVVNQTNADVEVTNPTPLKLIGKGRQGAVFAVTEDICVKVYGNTKDCSREYYALSLGKNSDLFPNVYQKGPNYIVMDFVTGVDLREYLQSQPLTMALSLKLVEMLVTFKEIGFQRIDHHKRQIYVQPEGRLKVIDVGRTVWRDRVYPYPRKLLTSLGEENRKIFLSHVQEISPSIYKEWNEYMKLELEAQAVYQCLVRNPEPTDVLRVRKLCRRFLSPKNRLPEIESLLRKVFKEEMARHKLQQGSHSRVHSVKVFKNVQRSRVRTHKQVGNRRRAH